MKKMTRRDFAGLAGKAAAGGLLLWLFGRSFIRKQILVKEWESCTRNGLCRGCTVLSACGLPQALSFKKAGGRP